MSENEKRRKSFEEKDENLERENRVDTCQSSPSEKNKKIKR